MTTGATGQLGLALPVQGELSGTWGDTVNNGITQYTNIAIAGTLTLTGDGAVTLANTTGDASASNITSTLAGAGTVTAQFAIVKVSGTTTTKVVTGPSYSKTYVVDNASSFAVTFKASGQTGVSIAAAEKVTVVFNGTDYIKLAGTIANAAGSNTQIQFNNGGLFGASANLTWDGTTLSSTQVNITGQGTLRLQDTTGGEYVGLRSPSALGASYTLTFPADDGTSGQALITDGSGVLSWSTAASGDVYGPASATDNALARFDGTTGKLIKDSSGLTWSGTSLLVNGSARFGSSAVLPGFAGANDVSLANNAALRGTNSTGATAFELIKFNTSDQVVINNDGADAVLTSAATSQRWIIGSEQMRLTSTGLGIGTSSPGEKLNVLGGGATTSTVNFTGGSAGNDNATIASDYSLSFQVDANNTIGGREFNWRVGGKGYSDGTSLMTLSSAGNLGIGTSSPDGKLDVAQAMINGSTSAFTSPHLALTATSSTDTTGFVGMTMATSDSANYGFSYGALRSNGGLGSLIWKYHFNSASGTELMRLDSYGNLGLGVTPSAWSTSAQKALQVYLSGVSSNGGGNTASRFTHGCYLDGSTWKYQDTGVAPTRYEVTGANGGSTHSWSIAAGGTAGNAITFTQALTLGADGNLGVGETSPDTRAHIYGASTVGRGQLYIQGSGTTSRFVMANSSDSYSLNTYGDSSTSLLTWDTNSGYGFRWTTADTERARIDSSGNFGIGTSSPAYKLDVAGSSRIGASGASTALLIGSDAATTGGLIFADATRFISGSVANNPYLFYTNNSEKMRLDSSGNLGLGVTPSAWGSTYRALQIGIGTSLTGLTNDVDVNLTNNARFDGTNWLYIATSPAERYRQNNGQHIWFNAPSGTAGNAITFTQAMTLDASGRLGIGTTSPSNKLVLAESGATSVYQQFLNNSSANIGYIGLTSGGNYVLQTNNAIAFSTGASYTEAARIDSSGNLLVGTTSAMNGVGSDGKIGLQSSGASGNFVVQNSGDDNIYLAKVSGYSNSTFIRFSVNGTGVGSVTTNGTNTTYATSSDYRLKNTIAPMTGALAKVALLKPCTYKWNADGSDGEGFIAHELQAIIPDAVVGEKDAVDENGNIKPQGIDTSFLAGLYAAALQELMVEINNLKSEIAVLKAK